MVKISYDRDVDALYIRLKETTVTTDRVEDGIALDYDASDRLAGIEILDARKRLGDQEASKAFASGTTGSADDVGLTRSTSPQLSAIQLQVLDALRGVDTEEYRLGDWYLGALCALENTSNPDRISQAAQSLRELVEKLPRVVQARDVHTPRPNIPGMRREIFRRLADDKNRYEDEWKDKAIDAQLDKTLRKIEVYMESSQLPTRGEQIHFALKNLDPMGDYIEIDIQKQKRDSFHGLWKRLEGFAHHRSIGPRDEMKFMENVEALEHLVYDLLAPITAQDQDEIQAILNRPEHSETDAETLYKLISRRGANYVFFFTNTADPVWIPFLKSKGFFKNPPKAEYLSDGYVCFPYWPELQYLQEVCKHAPQEVLSLVLKLPAVDNPRVYANILDIALKLDGGRSARLLPKMLEYAQLEHQLFSFKFPDLLAYWASEDQTDAALRLANVLIQFVPDPKAEEKQKQKRQMNGDEISSVEDEFALMMTILRPLPRFNEIYQDILNDGVRPLAKKEPYKVARMLINTTASMICLGRHEDDLESDRDSDYSKIWCPRLDKPNGDYPDLDESLVQTLTFACKRVFKQESESIEALDAALRNRRWEVFKRLRQHLFALNPIKQTLPWIRELILQHRDYGRTELHYEFQRMILSACKHFGEELLTEPKRIQIFDAILSGPPEEDFRESLGDQFTETEFEKRRKFHRLQLRPFASVLFGKYADYFQRLEADETADEITDESYQPYKKSEGGSVKTRSPRSTHDLASLSDEELLEYINDWEDEYWDGDDHLTEINIDALAGAFQDVFKTSIVPVASRFSFWIKNRDKILRPIYIRVMIDAMQDLLKAKDFDKLEEWFRFCKWVLSIPIPKDEEGVRIGRLGDGSREHPRWHTSRRAVCDFVEACIEKDVNVPLWSREHLAGLLERLCTQFDWRLDNERPVLVNRDDQLTEAINTTRGRAMQNLVSFGTWVRLHDEKAKVPEIKEILQQRIRPDTDFPLTVPEYALLGMHFGSLFDLDQQWAVSRKPLLFPRNNIPAWREAFGNYSRYNCPYRPIFDELRDEYEFALDHLDCLKQSEWTGGKSANDYLGQHLFTYHLWDVFPLKGGESLLDRFYVKTGGERAYWARLFRYVGHSLQNTGKDLEKGIRGRVLAFFDWRLEVGEPTELQEFVFWLKAQSLEGDWVLNAYSRILDRLQKLNWDLWRNQAAQLPSHAIHSMREMLPEHTPGAVECLGKLIDSMPTGDTFFIPTDDAKAILNAGRDHDDQSVRKKAEETRENMLKRGFLSVKD